MAKPWQTGKMSMKAADPESSMELDPTTSEETPTKKTPTKMSMKASDPESSMEVDLTTSDKTPTKWMPATPPHPGPGHTSCTVDQPATLAPSPPGDLSQVALHGMSVCLLVAP